MGTWRTSSAACGTSGRGTCWSGPSPGEAPSAGSRTCCWTSPICVRRGSPSTTPACSAAPSNGWQTRSWSSARSRSGRCGRGKTRRSPSWPRGSIRSRSPKRWPRTSAPSTAHAFAGSSSSARGECRHRISSILRSFSQGDSTWSSATSRSMSDSGWASPRGSGAPCGWRDPRQALGDHLRVRPPPGPRWPARRGEWTAAPVALRAAERGRLPARQGPGGGSRRGHPRRRAGGPRGGEVACATPTRQLTSGPSATCRPPGAPCRRPARWRRVGRAGRRSAVGSGRCAARCGGGGTAPCWDAPGGARRPGGG
jgi:hypothetical protein